MGAISSMLLLALTAGAYAQSSSVYVCQKAGSNITIDGVLDEPAWKGAHRVPLVNAVDGSDAAFLTDAAMVWDEENLYVSFTCADPDMWTTKLNRDDPLWEEEVVEVFIDPDGDGADYAELEVNPLNAVVDLRIIQLAPSWNSDINWDIAGLGTAVTVEGTVNDPGDEDVGWTVEIGMPWSSLLGISGVTGVPSDGEEWRMNLYRIERPRDADWHLLAWSPVGRPAFHTPERFGTVRFSTVPVGLARVYVPPVPVQPGDEVNVPVHITDVTGWEVISADLAIVYDPEEAEFVSASVEDAVAEGWHIAYNVTSGIQTGLDTVKIAMATARESLTGAGPLVFLSMRVSEGMTADTLALGVANAVLNDGIPSVEGIPMDRVVLGDVSGNGRASALDAALILRYVVGLIVLPDPEHPSFTVSVADVSGNGWISAFDASLVLRYVVGLLSRFPVEGGYVPQTKRVSAVHLAEMELGNAGDRTLVVVPVVVEEMDGITSGQMMMRYDTEQFEVIEVKEAPLTEGFLFASRVDADTVKFCFAGSASRGGSGRIAEIVLRRRSSDLEEIGGVELVSAQLNEEPVEIKGGIVSPPLPKGYHLSQNYPNPFNGRTILRYDMPEAGKVEIVIFNAAGQPVRKLVERTRGAGTHVAIWDGTDGRSRPVSTGLYVCRMCTGSFVATRKVLLIR